MPTTLLSAVLFVVLLFPGYAYERRRERDIPERTRSPFRETLSIVFVGVMADAAALWALILASALLPSARLDAGGIVADPVRYTANHVEAVTAWVVAMVAFASMLAYGWAARPWSAWLARRSQDYNLRLRTADPQQPTWWHLLNPEHPGQRKYVACYLDDGSYIGGLLRTFSRSAAETGDRDLSLRRGEDGENLPLRYRAKGAVSTTPLTDVDAVIVSARRVVMLTVTNLKAEVRDAAPRRTELDVDGSTNDGGH